MCFASIISNKEHSIFIFHIVIIAFRHMMLLFCFQAQQFNISIIIKCNITTNDNRLYKTKTTIKTNTFFDLFVNLFLFANEFSYAFYECIIDIFTIYDLIRILYIFLTFEFSLLIYFKYRLKCHK